MRQLGFHQFAKTSLSRFLPPRIISHALRSYAQTDHRDRRTQFASPKLAIAALDSVGGYAPLIV
jgi:hypothetical protein